MQLPMMASMSSFRASGRDRRKAAANGPVFAPGGRDLRALIPYERVQPAPRPFGWGWRANRAFDVTRTVRAWREGAPNLGFVLSPEADAVSRNAATVGDVGDQFMCGVQVGGYELTVSMLVPRTAP